MGDMEAELASLRKDLKALRSDMKELVGAVATDGSGRLEELKSRLWSATRDWEAKAEGMLRDATHAVREKGEEAVERGREEVRKHPLSIVLGAAAVGVLVGLLIRRRR